MTNTNIFSREAEDVLQRICAAVGSPVTKKVSDLARNRDWDALVSLECDPRNYGNPFTYRGDAIAVNFLRKAKDLPTKTFDRPQAALDNFWKAEAECYRTNERLSPLLHDDYSSCSEVVRSVVDLARKTVSDILGACPDVVEGRFGPGATFADRGQLSTVPDKMSSDPTLTSSALPFLFQWSGTAWATACADAGRDPDFIRGNRFTTVLKDCRKDRGIAVEPSVNLFYQLGYGRVMRRCLKKIGLDIQHAQVIHRRLAREASIRGHLATIDLTNASDTVCINLVRLLLPRRWFQVLESLRSSHSLVKGKWVKLEKFSSMGNGFTFELETLLFYALSHAVLVLSGEKPDPRTNCAVFGDDIIVPTELGSSVIAVLRFFGFTPNKDKTFLDGPFRESCGGDYFSGVDVRPFFLKETPNEPHKLIAVANGLSRLAGEDPADPIVFPNLHRAWLRVLDAIPSDVRRCRGPRALGDIVIADHPAHWKTKLRNSITYVKVYRPAKHRYVAWSHFRPSVVLATAVYGTGDGDRGIAPRDNVLGYKVGWVPYS